MWPPWNCEEIPLAAPATYPTPFVIFGGGGDLTWSKLVPALYNLWLDEALCEPFRVIALDHKELDPAAYAQHLREGVDQFSRRVKAEDEPWSRFARNIELRRADFEDEAAYAALAEALDGLDHEWKQPAIRVFYLAVPP